MSEDDALYWQDVLDEFAAGRKANLRCPFCAAHGKVGEVSVDESPERTRLECRACKRFIEGRMR